jgi:hypothetical protein
VYSVTDAGAARKRRQGIELLTSKFVVQRSIIPRHPSATQVVKCPNIASRSGRNRLQFTQGDHDPMESSSGFGGYHVWAGLAYEPMAETAVVESRMKRKSRLTSSCANLYAAYWRVCDHRRDAGGRRLEVNLLGHIQSVIYLNP